MRARTARDEGNPGESGRPVARPRTGEGVREGGGEGGERRSPTPNNLDNLNLGWDRAARASPRLGVRVALRAVASHFAVELKLRPNRHGPRNEKTACNSQNIRALAT